MRRTVWRLHVTSHCDPLADQTKILRVCPPSETMGFNLKTHSRLIFNYDKGSQHPIVLQAVTSQLALFA